DKTTVFEIDQSIRIEDMKKDSFVSLASKQKSFTIRLTRADKKILLKRFYKKTPKRFGPENFALTIVFMIHESSYPITKIIIDKEYTNYERLIVSLIQRYYPHLTIVFQSVGKNSPAHEASFFTGLGKHSDSYKKQSQRYFANQEKKIGVSSNLKGFLTAELLHPEFTGIRSPHDLLSPKPYHKILDLSSKTNWVKVKHLKPGMTIATANGWEKISAIIPRGRKQTFDIQVAGTHNFVGNDIVAHNTYISGNVGIGTTAPANKLVVKGDGSSTGLMIGGATTYEFAVDSITAATDYLNFRSVSANTNTTHVNNILVLQRTGNVGIGTASPLAKLDVAGAATIGGQLTFDAGNTIQTTAMNTLTLGGATTGNIVLNPANAAAGGAVLPNTNNVTDIGSSTLQFRNIYATNFIGGSSGVQGLWQRTSGSLAPTNITDSINLGATATSSALVHLAGTANENSWINTGNVGIGTTGPIARLEVNGRAIFHTEGYGPNDISSANVTIQQNLNTLGLTTQSFPTSNQWAFRLRDVVEGDFAIYDVVNSASRIYINSSGNVGIGTTSPDVKLAIEGTSSVATGDGSELVTFRDNRTTTGSALNYVLGINRQNSATAAWYLGNDGNSNAVFSTNNSDMRIGHDISGTFYEDITIKGTGVTGTGNVGIGTTSPVAKLEAAGITYLG
ncbi:MAG: hypothetical protein COV79_00070, partial [Parcubacteria group bacterium CG11_big_fil_rev_8_21_14_0_20_41_14]